MQEVTENQIREQITATFAEHPETDDVCIDYRVERKHKEREKSKRKQK